MGVVDIVNFNADASCLSSLKWLKALRGKTESLLYKWLELYVTYKKKVVLGFPGATIADIATFNPESINLINSYPEIFQVIIRSFSHDIALLRTAYGFCLNLDYGIKAIKQEFDNIAFFYLPPEFMCTAMQIHKLHKTGIKGIFINSARFDAQTAQRIPTQPYKIKGLFDTWIDCIPFDSELTTAYLDGIHNFNAQSWNKKIQQNKPIQLTYSWRDGESTFLLPNTLEREMAWLSNESDKIKRNFLNAIPIDKISQVNETNNYLNSYPIHSFSAWIKEMKMYWYVYKVQKIEDMLKEFTQEQRFIWLSMVNSDILSSVEKKSPVIKLRAAASITPSNFTIYRQEKGFEGEEYLRILLDFDSKDIKEYYLTSDAPHIVKLRNRVEYLKQLDN